jgi:hypothetical protein
MSVPVGTSVQIVRVENGFIVNVTNPENQGSTASINHEDLWRTPKQWVCLEEGLIDCVKEAVVNARLLG